MELQHGLNDPAHHAAYAWGPSAAAHRAVLPLPDRLFLFGEHWRDRLADGGFWGRDLAVVGSARMDRYRDSAAPRPVDRVRVAVTTQGIDAGAVAGFVAAMLERLTSADAVEVVLKLHPAYETDPAPYASRLGADPRVRILLGSEGPSTLELIASAHLHVSISSTCHYEALALRTPTAVLPFTTHEIMRPLCRAGHADLLDAPDTLASLVRAAAERRVPASIGDHYFSPGATDRMRRELAALTHATRDGRQRRDA